MAPPPIERGVYTFPAEEREEVGTSGEKSVIGIEGHESLPVVHVRFDDCFPKWVRIVNGVAYALANCRWWCVYFHQGAHPQRAEPLSPAQVKQLSWMRWVQELMHMTRQRFLHDLKEYGHGILACPSEGNAGELLRRVGAPPEFLTGRYHNLNRSRKKTGKLTEKERRLFEADGLQESILV